MTVARTNGHAPRESPAVFEALSNEDPFQVLTAEHALIRLTLARVVEAAQRDAAGADARAALSALADGFEIHQRREDRVIYPLCERLFGGKDGVACVLRDDHEAVRRALEGVRPASGRRGPVSASALEALRLLLEAHFVKEERVLFPQIGARLAGRETAALAKRLRTAGSP